MFFFRVIFPISRKLIQGGNNAILHGIKHLNLHRYLKVMNTEPEGHQPGDLPARTQEDELEGMICTPCICIFFFKVLVFKNAPEIVNK